MRLQPWRLGRGCFAGRPRENAVARPHTPRHGMARTQHLTRRPSLAHEKPARLANGSSISLQEHMCIHLLPGVGPKGRRLGAEQPRIDSAALRGSTPNRRRQGLTSDVPCTPCEMDGRNARGACGGASSGRCRRDAATTRRLVTVSEPCRVCARRGDSCFAGH